MNSYKYLNKFKNTMLVALALSSVIALISQGLVYIGEKFNNASFFDNISNTLISFIPLCFSFFITFYLSDGRKTYKAFFVLFCTFLFYSVFTQSQSFVFSLLISLLAYYCFKNLNLITGSLLILLCSVIFAVLFTYLYDYYKNLIMVISTFISNKGNLSSALFGLINTVLSAFDVSSFSDMFYYKSFGSSTVIGTNVISGAINLFKNDVSSNSVNMYLSGHSYLIFLLSGAFSFLNTKLKGFEKFVFIIVFASMFLCGNVNYFLFYIFIESPYMFFSICVMASLCYFSAAIIQISSGFIYGGGIFEVLLNSDKYVYLITGSIVFVAIGYFVSKYFYEKYGVSSCFNIYIPKRLRKTVSSLGGVQNIIRISNDLIEVRNPKLINEIDLKCEVKENQIKIDLNKISDLKEYLG